MRTTSRKNQSGQILLQVAVAAILMGMMFQQWYVRDIERYKQEIYDLQGKRLAEITNAVVRYISSAGNPATGLLAPHQQSAVVGAQFQNGRVHTGLAWLKTAACGGTAPFELIACDYSERTMVGDNQQYRFVVSNDGTSVSVSVQFVDAGNPLQGLQIGGVVQPEIAAIISGRAEAQVTFSSMAATNTVFLVDRNTAVISANVGINVTNTPYQRTDGASPITGDEHFANGAGIIFDTAGSIQGASNVSSERFASYDRGTNATSTTKYLEPAGTSEITNLNASGTTQSDKTIANEGYIEALQSNYIEQLDPAVQNVIRGELKIGSNTEHTTIGQGHIFTTGNVYDANNPDYFVNLDGVSRMQDIAVGALNEALLSDRLPNFVQKGAVVVSADTSIPKPTCSSSGSPRLILVPIRWTTYFLDNGNIKINNNLNEFYADDATTSWIARMKTYRPSDLAKINDPQASALANIYCYFP